MANGTAEHTSMMVHHSDRQVTRNARLILLRKAGLFFPVREMSKRSRIAMEALDKHLVRREQSLIQLLDPPFDKSNLNPGYIKGYVPGVRENGGNTRMQQSGQRWRLQL